jgi:hypothetical protein
MKTEPNLINLQHAEQHTAQTLQPLKRIEHNIHHSFHVAHSSSPHLQHMPHVLLSLQQMEHNFQHLQLALNGLQNIEQHTKQGSGTHGIRRIPFTTSSILGTTSSTFTASKRQCTPSSTQLIMAVPKGKKCTTFHSLQYTSRGFQQLHDVTAL